MDFDVLSREDCLRLLASGWLGRISVSIAALPAILPVGYLLMDDSVVFRSAPSSKLDALGRGEVICFQADDVDRQTRTAWSVSVVGRAEVISDEAQLGALATVEEDLWPSITTAAWLRLGTDMITGRHIGAV
ncbi:MAG: pyridoxamine 5'-phosphate oxidase family protein [Acidimicrobiales bacterium]|nr:pyridoxamine 5'-phosphate oxidase family protein [Acidimicrobiales bacterium]